MISRRILRIKTMQALYSYYNRGDDVSINKIEKELTFSIQKSYDLYHYLMILIVDISLYAEKRIEIAKNKRLATSEDLNPNTKFIDNRIIEQIRINNSLLSYLSAQKLNWSTYPQFIKELYNQTINTEAYKKYMASENISYKEDKELVSSIFVDVIAQNESLYSYLEEQSIYWNDEVEFIIGIIIKTIKSFKSTDGEYAKLLDLFKNSEDESFAKRLFRKVVLNNNEYKEIIEKFCLNWDFDRIAFMDILLMTMAIAEVIEFSSIPTRVTFNEYIELSKYYSTNKSNLFINGLLDKAFKYMKDEKMFVKQGRGLIGEEN